MLASLLPWREADDRVTELKPWVRIVVTGYIVVLVPVLAGLLVLMLVHAPRMFATAYDSLNVRWDRVSGGEGTGQTIKDAFQMIVLVLPCLGLIYTTSRIGHRAGRGAWRWSDDHPGRRVPLLAGSVTALAIVAMLWWPRGDYRPIERGERGTVLTGISGLPTVARERLRVSAPTPSIGSDEEDGARTTTTETGVTSTTTTPTTTTTTPAETPTQTVPAQDPGAVQNPAAGPTDPAAPADPTLTQTVPIAP